MQTTKDAKKSGRTLADAFDELLAFQAIDGEMDKLAIKKGGMTEVAAIALRNAREEVGKEIAGKIKPDERTGCFAHKGRLYVLGFAYSWYESHVYRLEEIKSEDASTIAL